MTDKQIIFGVDVSKCPYAEPAYGSPKCRINGYVHCDGFRNCEYKQLKRKKQRIVELNKTIKAKEQECERLKHNYEAIKQCNDNNMQTLDEAIKKKDEAERKLEKVEKQYKCYSCGTCNGKEDYYNLAGHHENAIKSLHKAYEQLDQLKSENKHLNNLLNQALKELEKTRKTLTEMKEIVCRLPISVTRQQILQKISECEVE